MFVQFDLKEARMTRCASNPPAATTRLTHTSQLSVEEAARLAC